MVTANCSNFANYRGQIWSELLECLNLKKVDTFGSNTKSRNDTEEEKKDRMGVQPRKVGLRVEGS